MALLLDTNVISEVWKPRPNPRVAQFLREHHGNKLFLSVVTIAEIRDGAEKAASPERQKSLKDWLTHEVRAKFVGRTLPIDEAVMMRWIDLVQQGRRANHTYPQPDLFLAATALEHDLTLVTRNTRDFSKIPGLILHNPWEPQP